MCIQAHHFPFVGTTLTKLPAEMVTRGLYGFYFRGRYWIKWQYGDAYFNGGLGQELLGNVLNSKELFLRFKAEFDTAATWLQDDPTNRLVAILRAVAQNDTTGLAGSPDEWPEFWDIFAEYSYVVDLDSMQFIMKGRFDEKTCTIAFDFEKDDWKAGRFPYPAAVLDNSIKYIQGLGYTFLEWISLRSRQSLVALVQDAKESKMVLKVHFDRESEESIRELAVAQLLLNDGPRREHITVLRVDNINPVLPPSNEDCEAMFPSIRSPKVINSSSPSSLLKLLEFSGQRFPVA